MTKAEIVQRVVNVHNTIAQIMVSGDNAIAISGALIELRQMVSDLQQDLRVEENERKNAE